MISSKNGQIKISIIIAAWNGSTSLRECLLSLQNQIKEGNAEVIVVSNFENGISEVKAKFPFAEYFILSRETTVPQLRSTGIIRACGAIVALTEDLCIFNSDWCREIVQFHELPYAVIGGAVENTRRSSALDWAVFFFDYGKYMQPLNRKVTETLSGLNVSYKKEILESLNEKYENEFFETVINETLKHQNHELYLAPSAIVYHNKTYNFKKTIFQFYHQSRSYAAQRVAHVPKLKKLLFVTASLVLPILLFIRIVFRTISKQRNLGELIMSLPFLVTLTTIWAFGEFCGYLVGEGKSRNYWR
jgi:glycosyltransferase involved in cell wall biosynthesis